MKTWILAPLAALALAGCETPENNTAPLIFGQVHTVELSAGPSTTGGTGEVVLGYKDVNLAIVPTVVPGVEPGENGYHSKLVSIGADRENQVDAYSTFGQFQFTTEGAKVGLGKFFATGLAA